MSEIDIFVSPTGIITLDHLKNVKYNTFVGNTGHFDNEVDLACSEGLDGTELDHIKPQKIVIVSPVGHGASRIADVAFQAVFRTFPRFQKSAGFGRQCGDDPPVGNFQLMDAGGA